MPSRPQKKPVCLGKRRNTVLAGDLNVTLSTPVNQKDNLVLSVEHGSWLGSHQSARTSSQRERSKRYVEALSSKSLGAGCTNESPTAKADGATSPCIDRGAGGFSSAKRIRHISMSQ